MQFRVVTAEGDGLKPARSLVRWAGMLLAALPLFAGFLPILFDGKRRGLNDRLAGTVVLEAEQVSLAASRRASLRASA
jgi:uncharacterized RDD family membrane protein YckC